MSKGQVEDVARKGDWFGPDGRLDVDRFLLSTEYMVRHALTMSLNRGDDTFDTFTYSHLLGYGETVVEVSVVARVRGEGDPDGDGTTKSVIRCLDADGNTLPGYPK